MPNQHAVGLASTDSLAKELIELLRKHCLTLGVAESLTGGLVSAALVDVPGASDVFAGSVIAYANQVKAKLLGVDAAWLAQQGPVNQLTACQMALGVRQILAVDAGIATTGVAGPGPSNGIAAGTVFVACSLAGQDPVVRALNLRGTRAQIRAEATASALDLATSTLRSLPPF